MQLEEYLSTWDTDTLMNYDECGQEARKIPILHAKYLRWLSLEKLTLKQLDIQYKKLCYDKYDFFKNGSANIADFAEKSKNWKVLPEKNKTIPIGVIDQMIEVDEDVVNLKMRKELCQTKIEALEYIMKQIMTRSYVINNMITWQQWNGGGK